MAQKIIKYFITNIQNAENYYEYNITTQNFNRMHEIVDKNRSTLKGINIDKI